MNLIPSIIPEVFTIQPQIFGDHRGYFFETFRQDCIPDITFIQDNESKSSYGVLRGLHFQKPPHTQSKLIRCIQGKIMDVAVDIRTDSPTFGEYTFAMLDDKNKNAFFVPRGFAHGFVVLSQIAIVTYKCDNYYAPMADAGISYNDPAINVNWQIPEKDILLSEKDKHHPLLSEIQTFTTAEFNQNA